MTLYLILVLIITPYLGWCSDQAAETCCNDPTLQKQAQTIQSLESRVSLMQRFAKDFAGPESRCPSTSCPRTQYTYKYKSSSYLFMTASVDWLTAHMNCMTCGAQLVSIETEDENEYLRNVTKNTPHFTKSDFYTSGTDHAEEGAWAWASTGKYISYSDWYPGQPEGGRAQNCLTLYKAADWTWHDVPCHWTQGYICEIANEE